MKSTGIVRKIDAAGRISIPAEFRRTLGINEREALEIYVEGETILLKKYVPDNEREEIKKELTNFHRLSKKRQKELIERTLKIV